MSAVKWVYWVLRVMSSGVFLTVFAVVAAAFMVMALWLVIAPLVPPAAADWWRDARCTAGYPAPSDETCVSTRLKALEDRHAARMREERKKAAAVRVELSKRLAETKRRSALIERAITDEDITFFASGYIRDDGSIVPGGDQSHGQRGERQAIVGIVYAGGTVGGDVVQGWCWAMREDYGLDIRVMIGRVEAGGTVTPVRPSASALKRVGWDIADLEKVQRNCPWPKEVR